MSEDAHAPGMGLPPAPWHAPRAVARLLGGSPPVVYQLLIRLDCPARLHIASLGPLTLPAGWYVYSGSARRGSAARLARHLRRRKARRWHIDHLLTQPAARVVAVRFWSWQPGLECAVHQALRRERGAEPAVSGFGNSDCRSGCQAHLLRCKADPRRKLIATAVVP